MPKTLTFIGNGNMALAIAKGLRNEYDIEIIGRNVKKLKLFEERLEKSVQIRTLENYDLSNKTVIFCVKPQNLQEVSTKLTGTAEAFYSILAGTNLENLKKYIKSKAYVRAMPNMAASVQKSITTLTGDTSLQEEAFNIFKAIGKIQWLDSEKELDVATALAGSGPAYLALVAEALADGAVNQGLKRQDAISITRGLFEGFAELIQDEHPALLKDSVMSPAGTTAAGYAALESSGVRDAFIKAIAQANERAKLLSQTKSKPTVNT